MKIIHTADWHLGHQLYGYERSAEQQSMLAQIADIVESRRPDALLVSGDIFDTTQPSVAAGYTQALPIDAPHTHRRQSRRGFAP